MTEVCQCGHPKDMHNGSTGWCRVSSEATYCRCPCWEYTPYVSPRPSPESFDKIAIENVIEALAVQRSKGYTLEHDLSHNDYDLSHAAAFYALWGEENVPNMEEWPFGDWKESCKPKSRRENLVRAAAMLIAEIARLDAEPLDLFGEGDE